MLLSGRQGQLLSVCRCCGCCQLDSELTGLTAAALLLLPHSCSCSPLLHICQLLLLLSPPPFLGWSWWGPGSKNLSQGLAGLTLCCWAGRGGCGQEEADEAEEEAERVSSSPHRYRPRPSCTTQAQVKK